MIFNIYFQRSHSNPTWWAVIEIFSFGFSYLLFYSFWKVLGRPDFQGAADLEIDWPDIFRCIGWSTWASLGTSLKTLCGWSKIQIHRIYSEFHWWYILTIYRIYSAASTTSSSERPLPRQCDSLPENESVFYWRHNSFIICPCTKFCHCQ